MARLFDDTPDEILVLVVNFLQTSTLSRTCRRAWQLLQRRYTRYRVSRQNVLMVSQSLVSSESRAYNVHLSVNQGTSIRRQYLGSVGVQALSRLKEAPCLRTLRLDLSHSLQPPWWGKDLHPGGLVEALASLREAPSLHSLSLDLSHNGMGNYAAEALSALHTLDLDRR